MAQTSPVASTSVARFSTFEPQECESHRARRVCSPANHHSAPLHVHAALRFNQNSTPFRHNSALARHRFFSSASWPCRSCGLAHIQQCHSAAAECHSASADCHSATSSCHAEVPECHTRRQKCHAAFLHHHAHAATLHFRALLCQNRLAASAESLARLKFTPDSPSRTRARSAPST